MQLLRLDPNDSRSWGLWPEFERRVRGFLHIYSPSLGDEEMFVTELRTRWVQTPKLAGYWLVLDGEGILETRIVGHVLSYVQVQYTQPYIFVYQVESEKLGESRPVLIELQDKIYRWIVELNEQLRAAGGKEITYVEHWSHHPAKVWSRLVPEIKQERVVEAIRIDVASYTPIVEQEYRNGVRQ